MINYFTNLEINSHFVYMSNFVISFLKHLNLMHVIIIITKRVTNYIILCHINSKFFTIWDCINQGNNLLRRNVNFFIDKSHMKVCNR